MEQKNKGGRPTKTLSEKRKYQVLLRLNTMEYYTLLGKAREASITRTEFLRRLITKAEVKARIKPEDMQLIRTVSGMANNLNQICPSAQCFRHLCTQRRTECAETTYSRTYETIEAMIAKIIKRNKLQWSCQLYA